MACFWKIKACVGVIYFLVCVRRYIYMSLTCLPIFAWQWGRKHNNTEKNAAFWVKPHSYLILWQHGVFSFTKVCIFSPMVFIRTFITTLCFYDFCKTVLVKKCTPCLEGVVWFSPSKCHIFYTGFSVVLFLHNWSPLKPQNKLKKRRGRCPWAPAGAYVPRTLRTRVLKKWPPSQPFFAAHTPPKCNQFTLAF